MSHLPVSTLPASSLSASESAFADLGVGVVGAGRVGSVLAARLVAAGRSVVGVTARSEASRRRAAALVPDVPVLAAEELAGLADVLVLAVPDDHLVEVARSLARPGQVVVHTSGRHGLAALEAVGVRAVAVHPAMTFTGTAADLDRPFVVGVTARDADRALATDLAAVLGSSTLWVDDADRVRYHAALSHGANHLVTLVAQARELLAGTGAGAEPADVLRPLLVAALDNALDRGDAALTGPVARGDAGTVGAHLEALATTPASTRDAYAAMALATIARAQADGRLEPAVADRLRQVVEGVRPAAETDGVGGAPVVARTRAELRAALDARAAQGGGTVSLVPTMGALHDGHARLMRHARPLADTLVVSIFVNPTQFGPGEDYDAYPRTLDADLLACAREGVDVVFAPDVEVMYAGGVGAPGEAVGIMVDPGPLGAVLEGAARPTHFRGVLTVVAKLFTLVRPDVAVFGEKDFQQLALIRRMVRDLALDVDVVGHPIVRESDGLAMSSRNAYLSAEQHRQALALSQALAAGAEQGTVGRDAVLKAARDVLDAAPGVEVDYVVVTDPYLGEVPDDHEGPARIVLAARVGTTRLLDNAPVTLGHAPASPALSEGR